MFDLDNTLIDRDAAVERLLEQTFSEQVERAEFRKLEAGGYGDRAVFFSAWSRRTGKTLDQARWTDELCAHLSVDLDILEALRELSADFKLALVTNGGSATQRAKLKVSGLMEAFPADAILISDEVGSAKPEPDILWEACRRLQVPPDRALFVGDREEIDGEAARQAGLAFLKVNLR